MFKKLVSNLPFNPSLLHQVSFYTKRLREENATRRLGFGFVALAMFIQMFAVIAPPQKSLAYSSDYIVNGLNTRDDLLHAWDGQTADKNVAEIYGHFGLTRDDIAALPMTPNVTITSTAADYWTTGRQSLSAVSKAGSIQAQYKNSEIPINTGSTTIYVRNLKAWDIQNPSNSYRAFQGIKNGKTFWILQDCGNFTTVGVPATPTPPAKPGLELRKTVDGGARSVKPGDQFAFRFEYRNNAANSEPATNVVITDTFDLSHFDIVSSTAPFTMNGATGTLNLGNAAYSADYKTASVVTVKLKNNLPSGATVCNAATIKADNAAAVTAGGSPGTCITVIVPCQLDASIPATDQRCAAPTAACTVTTSAFNRTTREATLTTTFTSSHPSLVTVSSYIYDFGDNSGSKTVASTATTNTIKHTYAEGTFNATVTVNYKSTSGTTQTSKNATCSTPVNSQPDQPLGLNKTARNITQGLTTDKTTETKANAGDVIEYSLIVHNSYDYARNGVTVSDDVSDILDYADVDQSFISSQGGKFDSASKVVSWPAFSIDAGKDSVKLFRVTVKDPIPATNQPGSMSTNFDCHISNKFGNQVDVPINCPPAKTAEYVTTTLPKTGPGASLLIGFTGTVLIAYFFARSRLLAKELDIIRSEYATVGGF